MKRAVSLTLMTAVLLAGLVEADVKTRQRTQFQLQGVLGGLANVFGGKAAREGVTSTVAVKGSRKATLTDATGQIIDLAEEKVYDLDLRRKEYRVTTFAALREQWAKAKADADKRAQEMTPEEKQQAETAGQQLEFTADVRETGNKKSMAGHDTREVIVTITGHGKGQKVEESGGFIMTNTMWLAPKIAAIDEQFAFDMKYFSAIYGENFAADMRQMAGAFAFYPSLKPMMQQMQSESGKLQGTPLHTTMTFEGVKSPEQMKQAAEQKPSGGGGLGGMIGRRMMGNKGEPQQRSTVLTMISEMLSVEPTVTDADVAIPAGFRERK
jgi:hypothetical protein